jgi:hypothetical protein
MLMALSAGLLRYVADDALREVEEAIQVHGRHRREVVVGVVQEPFADEDPRVVDQHVNPPEAVERFVKDVLSGLGLRNVALDRVHVGPVRRGIEREAATTR